jgi:hypothetical protein
MLIEITITTIILILMIRRMINNNQVKRQYLQDITYQTIKKIK